jgi:CBS domain-containing protein
MLRNTTAGTLVADKTNVISAHSTDSLESVLGKLLVHNILSLPVYTEKNQLLGILSVFDILLYMSWGPYFKGEEGVTEEHVKTFSKLEQPVGSLLGISREGKNLFYWKPETPLDRLNEAFSSGIHRVIIPQPSDEDASRVHRMLTQTDVVHYIHKHKDEVQDHFQKTLKELNLPKSQPKTISSTVSALFGFKEMSVESCYALAVVDASGKIIGNLSASDLRGLTPNNLQKIARPVMEFLATQHGTVTKPVTSSPDSTLGHIVELLVKNKIHRVWIVDPENKPTGVVTLTDVISTFVN